MNIQATKRISQIDYRTNYILFLNILRKLSELSDDRIKTICHFSVTRKREALLTVSPCGFMICDLFFYLIRRLLEFQSLFVHLPWWNSLTSWCFSYVTFSCFLLMVLFTLVKLSLLCRDAAYAHGFLYLLWPFTNFISIGVKCPIINSVFSVAHQVWFWD